MTKIRFVSANVLPISTLMIQHENANVAVLSKACTPTNWHENAWENALSHTEPTTWTTPAYRHVQNFISTTSPETSAPNAQLSVSYAPTPPAAWNALQDTICSTEFVIFPANLTTVSSRILILKAFVWEFAHFPSLETIHLMLASKHAHLGNLVPLKLNSVKIALKPALNAAAWPIAVLANQAQLWLQT